VTEICGFVIVRSRQRLFLLWSPISHVERVRDARGWASTPGAASGEVQVKAIALALMHDAQNGRVVLHDRAAQEDSLLQPPRGPGSVYMNEAPSQSPACR
jgi:hypothetical protein